MLHMTHLNQLMQIIIISLVLVFSSWPLTAQAHPGGLDESGGHTCRTNCDRWGRAYGEYHYHGGNQTTHRIPRAQVSPEEIEAKGRRVIALVYFYLALLPIPAIARAYTTNLTITPWEWDSKGWAEFGKYGILTAIFWCFPAVSVPLILYTLFEAIMAFREKSRSDNDSS